MRVQVEPTIIAERNRLVIVIGLSLIFCGTGPSLAQEEGLQLQIEEVVVTARKREETVQDIPGTYSVFGTEKLAKLNAKAIKDLETSIPNFAITSRRSFDTTVTMRGVGASISNVVPGVGLYIDGIYQVSPGAFNLPFFDVERVEVAKGPQGTLYGRNSFAGAINIITRPPSQELEGDVNVEFGKGNKRLVAGSIAGPIVKNQLAGRLSVGVQRDDGLFTYSDGADANVNDFESVNARLLWTPTEFFSADFKYTYYNKEGLGYVAHQVQSVNDSNGSLNVTPIFEFGALAGKRSEDQIEHEALALTMTYSRETADLVSISTWYEQSESTIFDVDLTPDDLANGRIARKHGAFSQELRLQSTGSGPLKWLLGTYYTDGASPKADTDSTIIGGTLFGGGPSIIRGNPEASFDGWALFADAEYDLTDRITVGAGIRYDSVDKGIDGQVSKRNFDGYQPKVSFKYNINDGAQFYAVAAGGFREGGFNSVQFVGTIFESFENDELWSYEAGLKSDLWDGRGVVDLSVFYLDVSSFNAPRVVFVPSLGIPLSAVTSNGEIESYGVELDTSFRVSENLTVNFVGGYNKAEPTSLLPGTQPGAVEKGEQVASAPLWSYRIGGEWERQVGAEAILGIRLSVNTTGPTNWAGDAVVGRMEERDPYTLVDLSASLEWGNYVLSVFGQNITDERYVDNYLPVSQYRPFGGTTGGGFYGLPRYYGISLRASF
jgi:iron complex outermembrane receptor protein